MKLVVLHFRNFAEYARRDGQIHWQNVELKYISLAQYFPDCLLWTMMLCIICHFRKVSTTDTFQNMTD